jgi:excisionase family DNA binding protein
VQDLSIENFKAIEGGRGIPSVPINDKLVLSLKEAQALTGFSRERLREAIRDGSLKAQKIGKGWKVKRRDLDCYVESL